MGDPPWRHVVAVTGAGEKAPPSCSTTPRDKRTVTPHATARDDGKTLRILVVEDNPDGRETLRIMLGLKGHEVHEAATGPRGFEKALALKPDVAIVDIGLPGYDGYEMARRVRAEPRAAGICLVALTGYGQEEDRRNALRAGFDWFLVKPADIDALNHIFASL